MVDYTKAFDRLDVLGSSSEESFDLRSGKNKRWYDLSVYFV
jgi:hypothetical protein